MKGTTITQELLDIDKETVPKYGSQVTSENGEVHIQLSQDPDDPKLGNRRITGNDQFALRIWPQSTDGRNHIFLCDNEEFECPTEGYTTYMTHLGFNQVIAVADATVIQMSGTVFIGKKEDDET